MKGCNVPALSSYSRTTEGRGTVFVLGEEATASCALDAGSVHVWTVNSRCSEAVAAQFQRLLSLEERERAGRFRFERDRRESIIVHGVLRVVLGCYLGIAPQKICFVYGPAGKPRVAGLPEVHFNISHSCSKAILAVAKDREIGIDLEHVRPVENLRAIAQQFFCAEEAAELLALPAEQMERAFFACWTRKEAYLKASGDGFSTALDSFRVSVRPDEAARLIHVRNDPGLAAAWVLQDVQISPGYAAALAYRGIPLRIALQPAIHPADIAPAV